MSSLYDSLGWSFSYSLPLIMVYLHCRIRIPIWTANQMATLQYVELFILHEVRFRFYIQLPSTGIGSESGLELEYGSVNAKKPGKRSYNT